jgi:hypothetical protein
MARARPALQKAVNDILIRHGVGGKRLSLRQAERLTGLSPATVGELAKGNARTPETLRRFAVGFGEDPQRFLLLAGFVLEDLPQQEIRVPEPAKEQTQDLEPDLRECLDRFGRALSQLPQGRERALWKTRLQQDTELLELQLRTFRQD